MPKHGERLPYRVSYEWANGIKGAKALSSADEADMFSDQLERTAWARELAVTITTRYVVTPGGAGTLLETRTINPLHHIEVDR